ncbi:hypothetical protein Dimus_028769 [Dionaea muscipula]
MWFEFENKVGPMCVCLCLMMSLYLRVFVFGGKSLAFLLASERLPFALPLAEEKRSKAKSEAPAKNEGLEAERSRSRSTPNLEHTEIGTGKPSIHPLNLRVKCLKAIMVAIIVVQV